MASNSTPFDGPASKKSKPDGKFPLFLLIEKSSKLPKGRSCLVTCYPELGNKGENVALLKRKKMTESYKHFRHEELMKLTREQVRSHFLQDSEKGFFLCAFVENICFLFSS
ncbi:syntaxin-31 [Pyrus ussuriensis x Pyrus communis]|uniref:Syntaxin-31 n=1 Tax=Pyrus ussuriensis x Pyrus communis TaxID=2448454 RepID=A0A5N5F0H1_9ROSA|nr:syntaxin-31 [Pyrus ussuriensis x Pyrus communis]